MINRKKTALEFLKPIVELEIEIQKLNNTIYTNKLSLQHELAVFERQLEKLKKEVFFL